MLTVHHLGISQSDRIIWVCEELGIPYELKLYQRDPVTRRAPPEYKALHPVGMAPVITDGELVLSESAAIIEYIDATYGGGRLSVSKGQPGFADYLHWLHFANSSFMACSASMMMAREGGLDRSVSLVNTMQQREDDLYAWVEKWLSTHEYFAAGRFTAADILMFFPLTIMRSNTGRTLERYPSIRAYLERISQRPAYRRALKLGDPELEPMIT